jgi:rubrerythrin
MTAQPPEPPVDDGGDAVCWLNRVCPECGRFLDREPPTTCPTCGRPVTPPADVLP